MWYTVSVKVGKLHRISTRKGRQICLASFYVMQV
nr:MAG TPA: hypothetical protein [Caudoviricetes sp.]